MRSKSTIVGVSLGLCWVGLTARAQQYHYSIESLGTVEGGLYSEAGGINASGQVAGTARDAVGYEAVRYTDGVGMVGLGRLPSPFDWGSFGVAVNASGQVAGYSYRLEGTFLYPRAFRYTDGVGLEGLGTLGGDSSSARAINDAGQVVGTSRIIPGQNTMRAFRYTDGVGMVDLGTLGTGSVTQAYYINNAGQVVGGSGGLAFRYTDGVGMEDLGNLGGAGATATAINSAGDVVGYAFTGETDDFGQELVHAFLYTDASGMIDLGVLPGDEHSFADYINDAGHVLGWTLSSQYERTDFIWTPQSGMRELLPLMDLGGEWVGCQPTGINARGQIVGTGSRIGDGQRAFRLEPALAADADFDSDVDLRDFALFSLCYGASGGPPAVSCPAGVVADFDGDGDVDAADYEEFDLTVTGPN
ncbi:MAG: hypothetical protein GY778_00905 [bacterium]|nr:hypothetical protein [bacterium]